MVQRYKFESKSQLFAFAIIVKCGCFQWSKDTNLKANHNGSLYHIAPGWLFSMVQRYKFESKSQRVRRAFHLESRCFQWSKDTNLKANHNQ